MPAPTPVRIEAEGSQVVVSIGQWPLHNRRARIKLSREQPPTPNNGPSDPDRFRKLAYAFWAFALASGVVVTFPPASNQVIVALPNTGDRDLLIDQVRQIATTGMTYVGHPQQEEVEEDA